MRPGAPGAFKLWYNSHLPNLLRIPGYLWAQRDLGLDEENRFTALYGVSSPEELPALIGWSGPSLDSIAAKEFAAWQGLQGVSRRLSNVYEQISGAPLRDPLLLSDRPLSLVTADVDPTHEAEWDRWYTEFHVHNLLKVAGYVLAGRFRALDHPALALYECESEEALPSLRRGEQQHPEAQAELERWQATGLPHVSNFGWGFHWLISKHFKWMDG